MIRLHNIRYCYPSTKWILNGIDLSVDEGEYVFVGGANGSGKSTLGYLINGLVPHFFGGTLEGSVLVRDTNTLEQNVSELFIHVGFVFQNADAQLFNSTVEDEIAFGLESLGLPGGEINQRIREISRTLDIEDLLERSPETLSGGEKRLVAIASVLCLDPPVLVLDEPYGDLDWQAAKRVREILLKINQDGKTLVLIDQRVDDSLQDTTRSLILNDGKLLFDGPSVAAKRVLVDEHLLPTYPNRRQNELSDQDPVLTVKDLTYRIEKKEILESVSFELLAGETVAIIGRNGSGKTTLIKHFNGLLQPTEGTVIFQGEEILRKPPSEMAAHVGLSCQNPNDQFFKYRVKDEVLVGPEMLGKLRQEWLEEIFDSFDLRGLLDKSPYRLSEGEKRRVALASILSMRPKLLILDEPTSGLDGRSREAIALLLATLKNRGFTSLIATHDLDFAEAMADRWLILHEGRIVQDGLPQDLCNDEQLIRLGALPSPQGAPW